MPPTFFIKPAEGLIVRDPLTRKPLDASGERKPMTKYWLTREAEGSVEETPDPSEKSDPSEKPDKPKRPATAGGES